jgi:hypothetical protein
MQSLLKNIRPSDLHLFPFPHILVRDALPNKLCDALIQSFPPLEEFFGTTKPASNIREDILLSRARFDKSIDPLWRDFLEANTSHEFLNSFLEIFESPLAHYYSARFDELSQAREKGPGIRYMDSFDHHPLLLDALISINSPVIATESSVRDVHIDNFRKLFAGLFYLRNPRDDSQGGNLELYEFKPNKKEAARFTS